MQVPQRDTHIYYRQLLIVYVIILGQILVWPVGVAVGWLV